MIIDEEHLAHYGVLRQSGRYPWGSGDNVVSRSMSFMDHVARMRADGLTEVQIAEGVGMTTTELRANKTIAKNQLKQADICMAQRLKDKGYSNVAIGRRMEINESSVRALLAPGQKEKADVLSNTADMLRAQVAEKTYIDVGSGVENHIGVSVDKLRTAVKILEDEGYSVEKVKVQQVGTGFDTEIKVLAPPGTTQKDIFLNKDKIRLVNDFTDDNGSTFYGIQPPLQIDPKRVAVNHAEDGGANADGVIYVRPGVEDLDMGAASYAQVRIAVGEGHYLKGVAIYKQDMPPGVDLVFNTNKSNTGDKLDAMKPVSDDAGNPFGSVVRQRIVKDKDGNDKVTSAMNVVNEEGDWLLWSDNLSSQVLSKQSPKLAKDQLGKTFEAKQKTYDEIMALTNPVVKQKLLREFADAADSSAVHLKAAALPRQKTHIILPVQTMPETQVYAPRYRDGESVVLIRYPHAGKFEIPMLTVNNSHKEAKALLGQAKDAVGISPKVAERMSGADFDGDFVLVIPNGSGKIKTAPALAGLKDFDPKVTYPAYEGMPPMTSTQKGHEMGRVSNLISDMTIRRASPSELARAVRHSMVVIDAEKHNLNYRQSAINNNIAQLSEKYQGSKRGGASTIVSRAKSEVRVADRKPRSAMNGGPIDRKTGELAYEESGKTRKTKSGKRVPKQMKSQKLAEAKDANELSSGTAIEQVYADHSNKLKALANEARKESLKTPPLRYSPSANRVYAAEVRSLTAALDVARRNRPLERNAQVIANSVYRAKKQASPSMDKATEKKVKYLALEEARNRTGAKKERIKPTQREWDAIQAGAISTHRLNQILNNADMDVVRELATPRVKLLMNPANKRKAAALLAGGATRAQVADALGMSLTTLDEGLA